MGKVLSFSLQMLANQNSFVTRQSNSLARFVIRFLVLLQQVFENCDQQKIKNRMNFKDVSTMIIK